MSKKKKQIITEEITVIAEKGSTVKTASLRPMPITGPVPVKPAASNIQLTPIVQPMAFVPYSTQKQPLFTYDGYEDVIEESQELEEISQVYEADSLSYKKKKKRIGGVAILLILTSLLLLAALVVGKYVDTVAKYLAIYQQEGYVNGYDLVVGLIDSIKNSDILLKSNILPASIAAVAVFSLITLVASLIRICKKGACVVAKISVFFTLTFAVVALVMAYTSELTLGIGLFIVVGIAFVQALLAFLIKGKRRA